jgi:hypothetical protein
MIDEGLARSGLSSTIRMPVSVFESGTFEGEQTGCVAAGTTHEGGS